jgi:type I restriction enzyme S subunit
VSFWQEKFTDVVRDVSGGNAKLPQSAFKPSGKLAVVDQGQDFIAGFTDDDSYRFRSADLPVVVFGDHTKAIKFIDFPFAMGADGVKVLKPSEDCDAKYLFHYLRQALIPDAGYSRHYKLLKELMVPLPPMSEQRRLVAILDKADALRAKRREAIAKLDQLLQSVFIDMFGDPDTKSKNWPEIELSEAVNPGTIVTYGIVQAGAEFSDGVPYIRTGDIVDGEIETQGLRRTNPEVAAKFLRSRLDAGDIVMSIRATVGTTALVPAELEGANLTQGTARIAAGARMNSAFMLAHLRSVSTQRWIGQQVKGATFREITLGRLRELPIMNPPRALQDKFGEIAARLSKSMMGARASARQVDLLICSLQQQAFSGFL